MRIGWIGFHIEGIPALRALLQLEAPVVGVITLSPAAAIRMSGVADLASLCRQFGVPVYEVDDINSQRGLDVLRRLGLDLAFVIGWTQLVRPPARSLVRRGMIGAHASLLPHGRGRAPVNWALIRGERSTGNTLIWLEDAADAGDVIDQVPIPISRYDTCASLYARVAESNRTMILRALPALLRGERPGTRQPATADRPLPRRRPEDGRLDFSRGAEEVYDFVRALTRPYPGAFSWMEGERWIVWQTALVAGDPGPAECGEVIGPVVSPVPEACGQLVQCGRGAVVLLELENERGWILKGPELSERDWRGRCWGDG
ncbi:MAG TPA: methionyl-tRNA formyltransferase [Candidatus Dormibacteraeota bacterium]|nr:methionyl-tRNA formyltransferase [Candidatus Dormibacteraeota bacterium]